MNIYEKLQTCRVNLQKKTLKKSGQNTFSHYDYFELGDFLPQVNELMLQNKLTPIFCFTPELATLNIIDFEKEESQIGFSTPVVSSELKGCTPMQAIGAMQTYARRYLYVMALEISENDILNNAEVDEEKEAEKKLEKEKRAFDIKKIDLNRLQVLKGKLIESKSDEKAFMKYYKIAKLEDMLNMTWLRAIAQLDEKIVKIPKPVIQEDLGI